LQSTCVLHFGEWHTQRFSDDFSRAYVLVKTKQLYELSIHFIRANISYNICNNVVIKYYTPLKYRRTIAVTSMQLIKKR